MASVTPPTTYTTYELFIYHTEIDVLGLKLDFD